MKRMSNFGYRHFVRIIIIVDIIFILLSAYPLYYYFGLSRLLAFMSAIVLTTANAIIGYLIIRKYINESFSTFIAAFFGSMTVRLLLMAVIIICFILLIKIDRISFIIGLFISYIYKSVIEIYFIVKKSQKTEVKNFTG